MKIVAGEGVSIEKNDRQLVSHQAYVRIGDVAIFVRQTTTGVSIRIADGECNELVVLPVSKSEINLEFRRGVL